MSNFTNGILHYPYLQVGDLLLGNVNSFQKPPKGLYFFFTPEMA